MVKASSDEAAVGLSARLPVLTEREVSGLVIKGIEFERVSKPKWVVVGKVFSPRSETGH